VRIALFIDSSNFRQTVKGLGFEVDYKRFWSSAGAAGSCTPIITPRSRKMANSPATTVPDWLDHNGIAVWTKPANQVDEGTKNQTKYGIKVAPMLLSYPVVSITHFSSQAMAICKLWFKLCNGGAYGLRLYRALGPSRPRCPTNFGGRPTAQSISLTLRH
jgi:hypothetical protein